ncbi:MAG: hypothetical protein MR675_00950 [Lachnospira sp.]|nr:hypothetical protein [Lachnospira sp.]MDD5827656.1 hypothetical protein [Lachnospira sp.]
MKILDKFTNIGKAVLVQALGIQKNYIELQESTNTAIDYNNASCSNCKYREYIQNFHPDSDIYKHAMDACSNCPHKKETENVTYKKIYHNEKNRYGYRPMLKSNSLKLLLLLHFYHPDKFGIIKNVNLLELARHLNCNIKTIFNNLELLKKYTYISYSKTDKNIANILINDYENYYLPAAKGGRGFIVMSDELLYKLIAISSLISLRIHLRELISMDNNNLKGIASVDYKSISDIRSTLPDYCKPCVIRNSIKSVCDIFEIEEVNNNTIRFEINERYIAKKQKERLHDQYLQQLSDFILEFNSYVPLVNSENVIPEKYKSYFISDRSYISYKVFMLDEIQIEDLAGLAVHYSFDLVIDALSKVYQDYILNERPVHNLAGLISTIIRSSYNTFSKAA